MSEIVLRPYQDSLIGRTRASLQSGKKAPLLVSPCGSGKTVMFSYLAKSALAKSRRTFIMAHRGELLDQISQTLDSFHVPHGFIAAGREPNDDLMVQVCSVQSLARRLKKVTAPDLIIIDEAHHCTRTTTWGTIILNYPNTPILGVTASPRRLSGEALGDIFDDLILGPTVTELTELKALCPYKLFLPPGIVTAGLPTRMGDFNREALGEAVDRAAITGSAIREYTKHASGKRAIAFCVSIKHAQNVSAEFMQAGFSSAVIDGSMPRAERKALVDSFRAGHVQVLTSCDVVSEGFDLPAIEVAIMLRPTKSLAMWIQQSGRALRPSPDTGKTHAIILDHAGNSDIHGPPHTEHEWSLTGRAAKKKSATPFKVCNFCYAANPIAAKVCEQCGEPFAITPREFTVSDEDLVEVDPKEYKARRMREQAEAITIEDLEALGRARGYKSPGSWAKYVFMGRNAKRNKIGDLL